MKSGFESRRAAGNREKVVRIDSGYGDSDVSLVESPGAACVRKAYQPERMNAHFQRHLTDDYMRSAVGSLIMPHLSRLRQVTPEEIENIYLKGMLERYVADTEFVGKEVNGNRGLYSRLVNDPEVRAIHFEVVPQGTNLRQVGDGVHKRMVLEGQAVIPGENLEQRIGVRDARRRLPVAGNESYPAIFSDTRFVDDVLGGFNMKLMRRLLQSTEFTKGIFPIFNRTHPANVIPTKEREGVWRFNITDLSASLCMDYALLIAMFAAEYDKTGRVYR